MKKILTMLCLLLISQSSLALSYTMEITEQELQSKIMAMMPIEKDAFFIKVKVLNPKVSLHNTNNQISIASTVKINAITGYKGDGKIKMTGSILYKPEKAAFYFINPVINTIEIENVPQQYMPQIKAITQNLLQNSLSHYPIYTLDENNENQKLAKSYLKSVTVEQQILKLELSLF